MSFAQKGRPIPSTNTTYNYLIKCLGDFFFKKSKESPTGDHIDFPKKKSEIKKDLTFSDSVIQTTQDMIKILQESLPMYRPPKNLKTFHADVKRLIEDEKQDIKIVLKTFKWATRDKEKRNNSSGKISCRLE